MKLLKVEVLNQIYAELNNLNKAMVDQAQYINRVLSSFEDEQIVQQFYASGFFGAEQKQKIQNIRDAYIEFCQLISNGSDSLVHLTKKYVEKQIALQNSNQ